MSQYDVDLDAPRRIEAITADGLRALSEVRQRSEDIDKAADEMFERQEQARQAMDEQVRLAAAEQEKAEEKPEAEERPKPKRTLSLGGDEFHQPREAEQSEEPKPVAPPQPPPPAQEPVPEPKDERPSRTLKLGAPEDRDEPSGTDRMLKLGARDDGADEPKPEERPARRPRPPRPEGEDDMSGRTWLR